MLVFPPGIGKVNIQPLQFSKKLPAQYGVTICAETKHSVVDWSFQIRALHSESLLAFQSIGQSKGIVRDTNFSSHFFLFYLAQQLPQRPFLHARSCSFSPSTPHHPWPLVTARWLCWHCPSVSCQAYAANFRSELRVSSGSDESITKNGTIS